MRSKIVVVSDSHGNYTKLAKIIKQESPFDYLAHCGDGVYDLFHVELPAGCIVWKVAGNVDLARGNNHERLLTEAIDDYVFMVAHGDLYDIKNDYAGIIDQAKAVGASVVLFGHTHIQYKSCGGPILINPGAAMSGAYAVIELNDNILSCDHKKLD